LKQLLDGKTFRIFFNKAENGGNQYQLRGQSLYKLSKFDPAALEYIFQTLNLSEVDYSMVIDGWNIYQMSIQWISMYGYAVDFNLKNWTYYDLGLSSGLFRDFILENVKPGTDSTLINQYSNNFYFNIQTITRTFKLTDVVINYFSLNNNFDSLTNFQALVQAPIDFILENVIDQNNNGINLSLSSNINGADGNTKVPYNINWTNIKLYSSLYLSNSDIRSVMLSQLDATNLQSVNFNQTIISQADLDTFLLALVDGGFGTQSNCSVGINQTSSTLSQSTVDTLEGLGITVNIN